MTTSLDLTGIPDLDGVPFAQAYADHFADLTAYEAEHGIYTPRTVATDAQLLEWAGLADRDFARFRGVWVGCDLDGNGPFLVVHTRNGGGNREHWFDIDENLPEQGPDCECVGCIQTYRIPTYPGYVHDENSEDDPTYANNYFTLPTIPEGYIYATDDDASDGEHEHLTRLWRERERIENGSVVPWSFAPDHRERRMVAGSYRDEWLTVRDAAIRRDALTRDLATTMETAQAIRRAYDAAKPVAAMPKQRTRPKTGARGQRLRTREPIPVQRFDVAFSRWQEVVEQNRASTVIPDDLDRLARDESIDAATHEWLLREADMMRRFENERSGERLRILDDARYAMEIAWFVAPEQIAHYEREAEALRAKIDQLDESVTRTQDRAWWTWPGEDYDDYRAWMDAHEVLA